ncbi:MAG: serine hydrolase domain-containing protein [Pseudoclavibacter sp.]
MRTTRHETMPASSPGIPTSRPPGRQIAALERRLDRMTRRRASAGMPAPTVVVRSPGWSFDSGLVDRPFHAASAGKLFTATLVAMLAEEGALSLDDPIGRLLPADDIAPLPAAAGVDAGRDITVWHLLTGTSGLPDYFEPRGRRSTRASIETVHEHPDHLWTPRALLVEAGTLPPDGRPGERFAYSDTNWVLLGRIAEEAGGAAFSEQLRTRIFEPCGMASASTPYDATLIADDLGDLDVQPFWLGRRELSRARTVSLDWAGGNIVATPDDWVRFSRALHAGRLISPVLLAQLARPRNRFRQGIHCGAGTMRLRFGEFFPALAGLPVPIGHLGVWAAHVFTYPELDAHVVLNFHSTREMQASFMVHVAIARMLAGAAR